MKPINPHEDSLMPQALKEYAYILKNQDKKLVKKLGTTLENVNAMVQAARGW